MKRFGLIGDPIAHSMSPALFRAAYGGQWEYDLIEGADFETSYSRFLESYHGINVTAPFKEKALAAADIMSPECRRIGAANLLVKTEDGTMAFNTDYHGVFMSLKGLLEHTRAKRALIVGLGGAGMAAAAATADLNLETVLMNRTLEKAERYASGYGDRKFEVRPLGDFRTCFREADVIVYTLPAAIPGIASLSERDLRGSFWRSRRKVILEANYRRPSFDAALQEKFMKWNPKAVFVSGETWLLNQAYAGYGLFTGKTPDYSKMSECFRK